VEIIQPVIGCIILFKESRRDMKKRSLRKTLVFLRSMKFGIFLLILIMLLSMVGTFIPQGLDEHSYSHEYSEMVTKIIIGLGLDDVYNSKIFGVLFVAFTLNLFLCSTSRFFKIIKKFKGTSSIENIELDSTDKIENKIGYLGSWLLHFGILLVIIFYSYGHITYFTESVYGVPGMIRSINGTEYQVKINDFTIEYDEEGVIKQYISQIDLLDKSQNILKSSYAAVNSPMRYEGYTFYQTAYGWAAECQVLKSGENLVKDIIYEQTSLNVPSENIGIFFNKYYPDDDPMLLYAIHYRGQIVKMNFAPIGETIKWNQYEFKIDNPQMYTYIEVNKMKGQLGAAIGAFIMILGLFIVFKYPINKTINSKEKDSYVR
jgi:cytochrome c biogenesis protein